MTAAADHPDTAPSGNGLKRFLTPWTALAGACLGLAALTLLFPSTPTYDPWAWIIWGREIFHLDLVTSTGPSWKPLPVIFTTLFAPFGEASPDLWLVIARAGGFLALAAGFRVASRLVEQLTFGRVGRWSLPAVLGGVAAVAALIVQSEFVKATALGNSEGLLVASVLLAIDRQFDGDRRGALILGGIAGLFRPEVWLFLGPYGLYVFWREARLRPLVIGVGVALPVLWFVPEYFGSGDFFRAANRAQDLSAIPYSPAFKPDPTQEILDMTEEMVPQSVWWMAIAGAGFALVAAFRRRFAPAIVAVLPVAWVGLVAYMTENGYAGNPRYLLLATGVICVVAGAGTGTVLALAMLAAGRAHRLLGFLAVVVLCVLGLSLSWGEDLGSRFDRWERLDNYLRNEEAHRASLPAAVRLAGGSARVDACGEVTTNNFQVPMLAWYLNFHVDRIGLDPKGPGTTFQTKTTPRSVFDPPIGPPGGSVVGRVAPWVILQACARPNGAG